MTVALEKLITEAALAKLAGQRSFERGVAYFEDRAVLSLIQTGSAVKARVLGTEEYRVSLRAEGSGLGWSYTCPMGDEGEFCKHAVAAGLAGIARKGMDEEPGPDADRDDLARIRAYLESQSRSKSFLDEGDIDAALGEAKAGDCTAELWLQIARACAATHPQDAIGIYQAHVERLVARANNHAYDEAAELAGTIRKVMSRIDGEAAFPGVDHGAQGET
ncbi:MAG: hypothetical protein GEV05_29360 [Betaproteobacteria bacterium]|nr:hypothetical protein [Betaproteobacteria bacterium]